MYTREFWSDAGERAIATTAQTASALIVVAVGGDITGVVNAFGMDWAHIAGVAAFIVCASILAGLGSILKSLAAGRADGNPSVGNRDVGATTASITDEDVDLE